VFFSVKEFALFVQMETGTPLIAETIALTEKKVAMALGIFNVHVPHSFYVSACLVAHDNIYTFLF
jgi:hypothetical protein